MHYVPDSIPIRALRQLLWAVLLLLPMLLSLTTYDPTVAAVVVAAENPAHKPRLIDGVVQIRRPRRHDSNTQKRVREAGGRFSVRRRQSAFQQQRALLRVAVAVPPSSPAFLSSSSSLSSSLNLWISTQQRRPTRLRYSPSLTTRSTTTTTASVRLSPLQASSEPNPNDVANNENGDGGVQGGIDMDTLADMDIVLFSQKDRNDPNPNDDPGTTSDQPQQYQLGAVQEDGTLAPISAWTLDEAFTSPDGSETIEFVVDEEDRWQERHEPANVVVHSVLDGDVIGYGSRQVGGGKGPGNPHGEESELLYYVERGALEELGVEVVVKPGLEILW